jgi:hypothetical protein
MNACDDDDKAWGTEIYVIPKGGEIVYAIAY